MSLTVGSRLGSHEIFGPPGTGGPASVRADLARELKRSLAEARRKRTRT